MDINSPDPSPVAADTATSAPAEQQGTAQPCAPLTLDMSCLGPPFSPGSAALYGKLTRRGQLVTIAGISGVGKSLLAQNCAVYVIQNGGHCVWINCDMSTGIVEDRMRCILTDSTLAGAEGPQLDAKACREIAELGAGRHWLSAQFSASSNLRLEGVIDQAILRQDQKTRIVVVDGFDRFHGTLDTAAFDELCGQLAGLAADRNLCIVISSQCVRDACGHEIVGPDDLAFSMGKSNASSLVVALGRRGPNLLTAVVVKDRAGLFREQQVYRLQIEPSLRLQTMDTVDAIRLDQSADAAELGVECVNCSISDIGIEDPDADDTDADAPCDSPNSGVRLYHGTTGFIGIGRGIFGSAMFKSRKWDDIGLLVSLYEMANIADNHLHAPGTRIRVSVKRGQVMTSIQILAGRWGCGAKQVRGFLKRAERDGLIRTHHIGPDGQKSTTRGTGQRAIATVITLCHYDNNEGAREEFGRPRGTSKGTPKGTIGAQLGHDEGTTGARSGHTTEQV